MSLRYSHRYISPDDEARLEISCSDACDAVERLNLAKTIIMAIDLAKQSQGVGEGVGGIYVTATRMSILGAIFMIWKPIFRCYVIMIHN